MTSRHQRLWKKAACNARRIIVSATLLALLTGAFPAPARAAVPTYVVEFELNTKFERSLEHFLIDLFNTLQKREEDFTAAFELQKIMKAREDVNKLFQEVQQEMRNFGWAYTVTDERLETPDGLSPSLDSDLTISPVHSSRIIHDPLEFLYGEPTEVMRMAISCGLNYVIWDQEGKDLFTDPRIPSRLRNALRGDDRKGTYAEDTALGFISPSESKKSVERVLQLKTILLTTFHFGHWQQFGGGVLKDESLTFSPALFDHEFYPAVRERCDRVMNMLRLETPISAALDIMEGVGNPDLEDAKASTKEQARLIRGALGLPVLQRGIGGANDVSYEELAASWFGSGNPNTFNGLSRSVVAKATAAAQMTANLRQLQFLAGQGVRPENLYSYETAQDEEGNFYTYHINTEYVVSPAVVLLQKMQAATQATFDLAGQGFLYLDAEETPGEILGVYNLATSGFEDRKICNNAGACALLDPWLKPAADFRSVATIGLGASDIPLQIGPSSSDILESTGESLAGIGSGLPAPWEDEGAYLNIGNEKVAGANRYTIARFLNSKGGLDEIGAPSLDESFADNIGVKAMGFDYPINDWYDRVFEMYEAGLGGNRTFGSPIFTIRDWDCYVALWFYNKPIGEDYAGVPWSVPGFDLATYCN